MHMWCCESLPSWLPVAVAVYGSPSPQCASHTVQEATSQPARPWQNPSRLCPEFCLSKGPALYQQLILFIKRKPGGFDCSQYSKELPSLGKILVPEVVDRLGSHLCSVQSPEKTLRQLLQAVAASHRQPVLASEILTALTETGIWEEARGAADRLEHLWQ